jgi:transcriptional regulator with XRE-family HTH domain
VPRKSSQPDLAETSGAAFGMLLRITRETVGLTAETLADRIQFDRSYVTHVEVGRRNPSRAFAIACDRELRTGETLTKLHERINWKVAVGYHPAWFSRYLLLETEAVAVREWFPYNVPGLLQTESHMHALFSRRDNDEKRIEEMTQVRLNRQERLYGPNALKLTSLIDEGVLRRQVGGVKAMTEQLNHLLTMSQRPNVVLQVVPLTPRPSAPPGSLMTFLDMPNGARWFYSEAIDSGYCTDEADLIQGHAHIYDQTAGCALSVAESRNLIRSILGEMINMRGPIQFSDLKVFKSSYSADGNGGCVGVSRTHLGQGLVPIVDTTLGAASPILPVTAEAFAAFVGAVKAGEFPMA